MEMPGFRKELETLINKCSMENGSNTPDFILADYLVSCLENFNAIMTARDKWHGYGCFAKLDPEPLQHDEENAQD